MIDQHFDHVVFEFSFHEKGDPVGFVEVPSGNNVFMVSFEVVSHFRVAFYTDVVKGFLFFTLYFKGFDIGEGKHLAGDFHHESGVVKGIGFLDPFLFETVGFKLFEGHAERFSFLRSRQRIPITMNAVPQRKGMVIKPK